MITTFSPGATSRSTPSTAVSPLNRLVTFSRRRSGKAFSVVMPLPPFIDTGPRLDLFKGKRKESRQDEIHDCRENQRRHVEIGIEELVCRAHEFHHRDGRYQS